MRECEYCGGTGEIEVSFPVGITAEEPDIRSMMCPECNDCEPPEPCEGDEYDARDYYPDERPDGDY